MRENADIQIARRSGIDTLSAGSSAGALPDDLIFESSRRLKWLGIIYAATYFLAYFPSLITELLLNPGVRTTDHFIPTVAALLSMGLAISLAIVASRNRLEPRDLLKLGLIFEVVGALGIAMAQQYSLVDIMTRQGFFVWGGISWICVWILIFPMLIPARPRSIALAAFLAGSMDPLIFLLAWVIKGNPELSIPGVGWALFFFFLPNFICVGIAWFSSRIFYNLGKDVSRAREMGSYRLIELIGSGGMGEVWRAKHKLLVRPAAIKLIQPEKLGPGSGSAGKLQRRFEREAQATSSLGSPHAVDLYDFGVTREGVFYYVMELLNGLDMETLVNRFGPIPAGRCIYLVRQACHALTDAHANGLIHRDIKAANLFVCHTGPDFDFTKVLDFGLVKVEQEFEGDLTKLTADGIAAGTPAYMPPETVGGTEKVDERGDIYSLGCVIYWLLTGGTVFHGNTPLETVVKHVQESPDRPSSRSELPISAALDAVVLDCLAKDPNKRPQSTAELNSRLAACTEAENWTPKSAEAWWKSHLPEMVRQPWRGE